MRNITSFSALIYALCIFSSIQSVYSVDLDAQNSSSSGFVLLTVIVLGGLLFIKRNEILSLIGGGNEKLMQENANLKEQIQKLTEQNRIARIELLEENEKLKKQIENNNSNPSLKEEVAQSPSNSTPSIIDSTKSQENKELKVANEALEKEVLQLKGELERLRKENDELRRKATSQETAYSEEVERIKSENVSLKNKIATTEREWSDRISKQENDSATKVSSLNESLKQQERELRESRMKSQDLSNLLQQIRIEEQTKAISYEASTRSMQEEIALLKKKIEDSEEEKKPLRVEVPIKPKAHYAKPPLSPPTSDDEPHSLNKSLPPASPLITAHPHLALPTLFKQVSLENLKDGEMIESFRAAPNEAATFSTQLSIPDDVSAFIQKKKQEKQLARAESGTFKREDAKPEIKEEPKEEIKIEPVAEPKPETTNELKPLEEEDDLDLDKFKKFLSQGRKGKLKGINDFKLDNVAEKDEGGDEANDLMALLNNKTKSKKAAPPKLAPSFMDVFRPPTEDEPTSPLTSPRLRMKSLEGSLPPRENWKAGNPLIRNSAVKEDANKKGMRKTKKKAAYWGPGTGKAPDMEDQNLIEYPFGSDNVGIFCVFDGHAGANCAIAAKDAFPKILSKELEALGSEIGTDLAEVLKRVYSDLDKDLLPFEYEGCTSTTVVVWQYKGNRYVQSANVGDSTSFLMRSDSVLMLSRDHKATSDEEKQRIIDSGIEINRSATRIGGLAVSRALGDHFLKIEKTGIIGEPYVSPAVKMEDGDWALVVASDGLWDVMNGERAMELCQEASATLDDSNAMARRLLQQGLADPKCTDNTTVVVATL